MVDVITAGELLVVPLVAIGIVLSVFYALLCAQEWRWEREARHRKKWQT